MNKETRNCQNCKQDFTIEPEDFEFYKKIEVPPPTWCRECRIMRRMCSMNQRNLYRRKCDLCEKEIISIFGAQAGHPVYCQKCYWSDNWNPSEYGQDYDFSKPFFEQFKTLLLKIPRFSLQSVYPSMINSEYCNIASYLKNCYLMFNSDYSEDCYYGTYVERSKNSFDLYMADLCELCYESNNLFKCFKVFYSNNCNDCIDVYFSKNLRGCSNCFGCINLSNKQYYFFNEPCAKEEYFNKVKQYDLGSREVVAQLKEKINKFWNQYPQKFAEGIKNLNVSGNYIFNSKNVNSCYEVGDSENLKYCQFLFIASTKDCYDVTMWGGGLSYAYDSMGVGGGTNGIKFSVDCWANLMNIEYCFDLLVANSDLFGCVNLRNKKFCILNKQYSEAEYKNLIPKIKKHMIDVPYIDKQGRVYKYGEFFPPEIYPSAYNETIVQEYFPLVKTEALERGFAWKDFEDKNYHAAVLIDKTLENIKEIEDKILEQVLSCGHRGDCRDQCTVAFKITPRELEFYRSLNIPLPELCPNCRHYERLRKNSEFKLWHQQCMCGQFANSEEHMANSQELVSNKLNYLNSTQHFHGSDPCPNKFETSYAPERPEIIYCEECYQQEVL